MEDTERILKTFCGKQPIPSDICAQAMRVAALGSLIEAASDAFIRRYDSIMKGACDNELIRDSAFQDGGLISVLKKIADEKIIPHRDIVKLELMGRKVIHDLMDWFWFAASRWQGHISPAKPFDKKDAFAGKVYALISTNFRILFENQMQQIDPRGSDAAAWYQYYRALLVVDQVAGMTDTFAVRLHKELSNA